jgi:hypothetical protein
MFLCVKILHMMKVRMQPWVTAPMPSEQRKGFDVTISHTFLVFLLLSFIIHSYIKDRMNSFNTLALEPSTFPALLIEGPQREAAWRGFEPEINTAALH